MDAQRKKQLIIGGAGLLTVLVLYGLYKLLSKSNGEETTETTAIGTSNSSFTRKGFPLKYGSSGNDVKTLQKILNKSIRPPKVLLVVDGKFGKKTEAATIQILKMKSVSKNVFEREKRKHPDLIF